MAAAVLGTRGHHDSTATGRGPADTHLPVSGSMPLPAGSPPPPRLANSVPAQAVVTSESWVRLTQGPAQVVVTYAQANSSSLTPTSRDLLLLAWDHFAQRWVTVFDAAKVPVPGTGNPPNMIFPSDANVDGLGFATITSTPALTDLAFWAGVNFGANAPFDAYIVHYDGQSASVVYSGGGEGGSAKVAGPVPNQRLVITTEWISPIDPECCPVRNFTQTVSWVMRGTEAFGPAYEVTADTRSWLGVFVADRLGQGPTYPPPTVMTVVPGSPATGVLEPGDQLLAVAGRPPPPNSGGLGPPVIDEIDAQAPGTTIGLTIGRYGKVLVKNITLASYANPMQNGATAPLPGFLGISTTTDSPSLASQEGLGTSTGAVVSQVISNSPAQSAGLMAGDVITSSGATRVMDTADLDAALLPYAASQAVPLTYVDQSGLGHNIKVVAGTYPTDGTVPVPSVDEI